MKKAVTDSIFYVGANDYDIDLFEGQYEVPNGMAYNSYVIMDEKIAVMDTIDQRKTDVWLSQLAEVFGDRTPDYLVVQHMEPDHSASIGAFLAQYPTAVVVGTAKTFAMIQQFFPTMEMPKTMAVKEGDTLSLGTHILHFVMAPMVHWPEVMVSYEATEKILFSADAFGKFGALDAEEDWLDEARRYFIGIVGKYGKPVQTLLKKAAALDIAKICPLHGPVLEDNLGYYVDLYRKWSSYEPEEKGTCVFYTSVYGHTEAAVELLVQKMLDEGVPMVVMMDLARCDMAEAVANAFAFDQCVLATTTYNGDIFPFMKEFITHLTERNFQNRKVAFMENGSWAPTATKTMKKLLEASADLTFANQEVTILSAVNDAAEDAIAALAKEMAEAYQDEKAAE